MGGLEVAGEETASLEDSGGETLDGEGRQCSPSVKHGLAAGEELRTTSWRTRTQTPGRLMREVPRWDLSTVSAWDQVWKQPPTSGPRLTLTLTWPQ